MCDLRCREEFENVGTFIVLSTEDGLEDYTGSSYEEYVGGEEYIKYYMLYQKVIDMVVENAKGVDKLSTGK